jgi:hypothetical protein
VLAPHSGSVTVTNQYLFIAADTLLAQHLPSE